MRKTRAPKSLPTHRRRFAGVTLHLNQFLAYKFDFYAREIVQQDGDVVFVLDASQFAKFSPHATEVRRVVGAAINERVEFVRYSPDLRQFVANFFPGVAVESVKVFDHSDDNGWLVAVEVAERHYGRAVGRAGRWIRLVNLYFTARYSVSEVRCVKSTRSPPAPRRPA
ncbi:MAG: hypothetical protein Kow0069_00640 [Promethearchaeota archaeon]